MCVLQSNHEVEQVMLGLKLVRLIKPLALVSIDSLAPTHESTPIATWKFRMKERIPASRLAPDDEARSEEGLAELRAWTTSLTAGALRFSSS